MAPKTPPKPSTTLENPVFVGSTSVHSYDAALVASRKAVMEDLHQIPVAKIDAMLAAMFPQVDSALPHAIVDKLKSMGDINARGHWKAFDVEPSKQRGTEDDVYNKGLLNTFNQIIRAAKSLAMNIHVPMTLKISGSRTPRSDRLNASRPDGYFHLQSSTIPLQDYHALKSGPHQTHWADIVCPMEFKKIDDKSNRYDDMWKVVWSMHEIMRSDPRRRFAHGITIEDTTLRFWISHRAYLVASTPIDINLNHVDLVRILLGIALSRMDQLGYDTTMSRLSSRDGNDKYCYDISVHDHTGKERIFRTKDEISTYGADAVRGRGTRVWSAYDKTDDPEGKTLFALKDTWVNTDRPREGDTLRGLRKRLAEKNDDDALKHFLTDVTFGDVHVGSVPDNTAYIQNGKLFTVHSILEARAASDGDGTVTDIVPSRSGTKRPASSLGNVPNIEPSSAEGTLRIGQLLQEHRVHYRIVFEEIGTPVHKLRTFCDIFLALRDAVAALKAMFSLHLIHRDVSCSNILLVRAPGERARGLLVDLEYAKDITIKTTPHEFRTGTRDFMAVEVRESAYLFHGHLSDARGLFDVEELPPFQHNCLHDLESTWWIGLWTTYVFAPTVPSEQDVIHFHQLFPPPHTLAPRTSGLAPSLIQTRRIVHMRPEQNQLVFEAMHQWRYDLHVAYSNLETNRIHEGRLDESIFQSVHDEALRNLDALVARLDKDDLGTLELVHMQFSAPSKGKKPRLD